jgi:pimeloyl-ACP methyl ester carboxylesterase
MLSWYRALARQMLKGQRSSYLRDAKQRVTVPTLILWGEQDIALIPELAQWSLEFCDEGALVRYPEATHWVQHDEAERVTNRLLDFVEEVRKKSLEDIRDEVNE